MDSPTVKRGFNDEYGSWKMICISRRNARNSFFLTRQISVPSNTIFPADGSTNLKILLPNVVLPLPDSPTKPKVSPDKLQNLHCLRPLQPDLPGRKYLYLLGMLLIAH